MTLKTGFIMAIVAQVSDEARGPPVFVFSKNVHAMSGLRTGIFAPFSYAQADTICTVLCTL